MQRDDSIYVRHILDAARKALHFTANRNREDLDEDEMLAISLVHLLEIVGEAANLVSETRIASSTAKGLTRFIGRGREMETLVDAFDKVQLGEGQVVGIVGEAGVGKSRLLLEFRNLLPKDSYWYFEGHCLHYGGAMPYLPILDVLRSFLEIKEGEQEHIVRHKLKEKILGLDENLRPIIPPIQELLSLKVDDEAYARLEPKQKRERTFEAIRDLLIRGSQDRPLILAVEDLHWIDKTTEEFLSYMIGWLPRTRILLLLLYRPEYTHQWGSKSYYRRIGVEQLSTGTSAELVGAILDGDVVTELRDLILTRAAGNPLFMEKLTYNLLDNGSIRKEDDRFVIGFAARPTSAWAIWKRPNYMQRSPCNARW